MNFVAKNRRCWHVVLLELWLLSVHLTLSSSIPSGGSNGKDALLPPIPRWQESWTASQTHGTAMAMVVRDCVVIFLRAPSTNVYKPTIPTTVSGDELLYGLPVGRIDEETQHALMHYAPSWFPVGSHTLCAMTGLALDVEHICRVLQKRADDHYFVYQTSMTTHAMTQTLALALQNECVQKGSRPFGVQCLLVGCDDIDGDIYMGVDAIDGGGGLCLYSIDPTGAWQSWGRATAIGKFGLDVRRILAKKLRSVSSPISELEKAVECLFETWKQTCNDLGMTQSNKEDNELLILRKDPKNSRKSSLYRLPADEIDRIMEKVDAKTTTANSL